VSADFVEDQMRRAFAAVCLATALLASMSTAPARAIVAGAIDGSAHPYVGALLAPTGRTLCSGVLVATENPDDRSADKVFLTSAHCLGEAAEGKQVRVTFGATAASGRTFSGTFHVMAGYVPTTFANDVAIVVFSSPPAIPAVGLDDGDSFLGRGATVTTVGYGTPSIGIRKSATEIVTSSSSSWLNLRYGSGNSCNADSGGPDLIMADQDDSAVPRVVALTDQGSCSVDQDYRVNTSAVRSFVNDPDYVTDSD
jgi:secreted trypsin-like serine protease